MSTLPRLYLFRRGNGIYFVQYFSEGRLRWKTAGCKTKADALKALTRLQDLLKEKPIERSLSIPVRDFLAYARTAFSTRTVDLYTRALTHFQTLAGDVALSSLTARDVDLYKGRRLADISPVNVNMELRALKVAMNTAVRRKLLEMNPFLHLQAATVPDAPPSYLTRVDFQKLMAGIGEGWLHDLVVFAVSTGVRQGEMLNLRWQDVDLDRRLITIQSGPSFRTKAGKWRVLPMNDVVAALLRKRVERVTSGFVFTRTGRPIGKSYLQHRFKRFFRQAGLDDRLHWHSLRHTHATWLVQSGATLYEVQRLLGHSSPRVTEIYSHLLPEHLHKTVNRIEVPLNLYRLPCSIPGGLWPHLATVRTGGGSPESSSHPTNTALSGITCSFDCALSSPGAYSRQRA